MPESLKKESVERSDSSEERAASHIAELAPKRRGIRDRKLRARRIRVDELSIDDAVAEVCHSDLGSFCAHVQDLSLHGMQLVAKTPETTGLVLSGDRLANVRLTMGGHVLFAGDAMVRRVSESEGGLVLGVELPDRGIDLAALYRLDHRVGIGERLRNAVQRHQSVSTEFKAWIADLMDFFEATKECLDREEAALAESDLWTRDEAARETISEAVPIFCERLNRASEELTEFVADFGEEEHAVHRHFYRRHLCKYFHRAPLLRRAYYKPLGYSGDYEMMNMLYRSHCEGETLFGKVLNIYACQEAAALANINRIGYFGRRIKSMLQDSSTGRLRIASVGCGPAHEVRTLLEEHPEFGPRLDVALIDQEERAIQYCERTLSPVARRTGARIHLIGESIRRLLASNSLEETLGTRDLIYSAGLFDYLSDRSFEALLRCLYGATAPGGHVYVGNVNLEKNTTKWSMEYASDWYLIHRTREQLVRLGQGLDPQPTALEVEAEPLGVNLFLHILR